MAAVLLMRPVPPDADTTAGAAAHARRTLCDWTGVSEQEDVSAAKPELLASIAEAIRGGREARPGCRWEEADLAAGIGAFSRETRRVAAQTGVPMGGLVQWPKGRAFAAVLTHDVDQIHDRGVYRTLADLNHLQKVLRGAEPGRGVQCLGRMVRSLAWPAGSMTAFRRIREIEASQGYRSTFFFLEGHVGRRYGARYSWRDRRVVEVAQYLLSEGCEVGVHGGYYDFDDAAGYRRSAVALKGALGVEPEGIRNHFLRWAYPGTWRAQAEAGYAYDATFGRNDTPGFRCGVSLPFRPWDEEKGEAIDLLVLPLTVMDGTLFRRLALDAEGAWDVVAALLTRAEETHGLVTFLWHNNYFAEAEYAEWESTYARLVAELARRDVWCATAGEVARWWRRRSAVRVVRAPAAEGGWAFQLRADAPLEDAVFRLSLPAGDWSCALAGERPSVGRGSLDIALPALGPDRPVALVVSPRMSS